MRRIFWVSAFMVVWLTAGNAHAQEFSSGFTGVRPAQIQFKQIDVPGLARSTSPVISSTSSPSMFGSLTNFFRSFNLTATGSSIRGNSAIPRPNYRESFTPVLPTVMTIPR